MRLWYLIFIFLHVLSAMVWIGGLMFFVTTMVPFVRKKEFQGVAGSIVEWIGLRFRYVGWLSLWTLVLTGLINLYFRGYRWPDYFSAEMWTGYFGETLAVKLILVAIIFILSAVHDFYIGPKATALWKENPDSPDSRRYRKAASWIGRVNLALGLCVLMCAIMLIRGWPW